MRLDDLPGLDPWPAEMSEGEKMLLPEERLWQAKILQYLRDSVINWPKKEAPHLRQAAVYWFSTNNMDFIFTCEAAGFNHDTVIAMYRRVQHNGSAPRMLQHFVPKMGRARRKFSKKYASYN